MANDQAVARHAANDLHQAAHMPSTIPKGYKGARFLVPDLPENNSFTLLHLAATGEEVPEDGASATLLGPFSPQDFVTDPTTCIASAHQNDGTPIILRVVSQKPISDRKSNFCVELSCVNGEGESEKYLVHTVPDNELEIEDL